MKIDCELNDDEKDLLLMMLGAGTASTIGVAKIDMKLAIVNKLMKNSPNFTPYAVPE